MEKVWQCVRLPCLLVGVAPILFLAHWVWLSVTLLAGVCFTLSLPCVSKSEAVRQSSWDEVLVLFLLLKKKEGTQVVLPAHPGTLGKGVALRLPC